MVLFEVFFKIKDEDECSLVYLVSQLDSAGFR